MTSLNKCLAIAGTFSGSPWSILNLLSHHHRVWTTGVLFSRQPTNRQAGLSARNKNRWIIIFGNCIGASPMRIGPGCPPGRDGVMYICTSRFRRGVKGYQYHQYSTENFRTSNYRWSVDKQSTVVRPRILKLPFCCRSFIASSTIAARPTSPVSSWPRWH